MMKYKYIFGPVLSRRLGTSLGVDLVSYKTCSLDCVYCECGKTTKLTLEQKEYVTIKDIKKELDHFWKNNNNPDYITFSGSGEPTLNSKIGHIIEYIKFCKPAIKIAVLTNSTLLNDPVVRHALLRADLVIPSLDAASQKAFIKINRPDKKLDINQIINGVKTFANEYSGKLWLEVLILPEFNNSKSDLILLQNAIKKINPDLVQLNTLNRPGTMPYIKPASNFELERIKKIINFNNVEIIAKNDKNIQVNSGMQNMDIKSCIIKTISRRPCTKQDLSKLLDVRIPVLEKYIAMLETEKQIQQNTLEGVIFYQTIKDKNL